MKKIFFQVITLILLHGCINRADRKVFSTIQTLPSFELRAIDSTLILFNKSMCPDSSLVLIYFEPDCEHCQREAKSITGNIHRLGKTRLYWITNSAESDVNTFFRLFHLSGFSNCVVGLDNKYSFYRAYLPESVPYIAIYNSKKKLVKLYRGEVGIESIINAVQD